MRLNINFAPQLRAFGKAAGRQFTSAEIQTIEATMNSLVSLDETGNVRFDLGAGPVGTLDDAMVMLSAGMGAPASVSTADNSIPAGSTATERAMARNAAIRAGADDAKRQQATNLVSRFDNPWKPDRLNRSHQGFITNTHPQLAGRLKAEAGVRT